MVFQVKFGRCLKLKFDVCMQDHCEVLAALRCPSPPPAHLRWVNSRTYFALDQYSIQLGLVKTQENGLIAVFTCSSTTFAERLDPSLLLFIWQSRGSAISQWSRTGLKIKKDNEPSHGQ